MNYFRSIFLVLGFLSIFVLFPTLNRAQAQPILEKAEIDKALAEMKVLKAEINADKVTFVQGNKAYLVSDQINDSIGTLRYLKSDANFIKLTEESKVKLSANLSKFDALKDGTSFSIEKTKELEKVLIEIKSTSIALSCQGQDFNVTAIARGPSGEVNDSFEVEYSLATEYPIIVRRMNGGQRARVTEKVRAGYYYFWTVDPNSITRKGERKEQEVCGSDVPVTLPIPL